MSQAQRKKPAEQAQAPGGPGAPIGVATPTETMKITYLNRSDGNVSSPEIPTGTTVGQFLKLRNQNAASFEVRLIRAGAQPCSPTEETVLEVGDRLTMVPKNIEGAR